MKSRFDTAVGREITRLIAERCVTQRELARRLGLAPSTLNQMITGRMRPWANLLALAQRALG